MAVATTDSFRIRLLIEDNYNEWYIDIRVLLRKNKLWKYTQQP